mmetsp:Transcript_56419/g.156217  ORF Transcript_56419/g.156217 Transcript_56419/m.156217 type:complete len:279 (+) Transcript_56419:64-900(+)
MGRRPAAASSRSFKTKLCMFYPRGRCQSGHTCAFAHSGAERLSLPNSAGEGHATSGQPSHGAGPRSELKMSPRGTPGVPESARPPEQQERRSTQRPCRSIVLAEKSSQPTRRQPVAREDRRHQHDGLGAHAEVHPQGSRVQPVRRSEQLATVDRQEVLAFPLAPSISAPPLVPQTDAAWSLPAKMSLQASLRKGPRQCSGQRQRRHLHEAGFAGLHQSVESIDSQVRWGGREEGGAASTCGSVDDEEPLPYRVEVERTFISLVPCAAPAASRRSRSVP